MLISTWISMWIWWFHEFHVPNAGSWGLLQRQQTPAATGGDHPALQRGASGAGSTGSTGSCAIAGCQDDQLWPTLSRLITLFYLVLPCFTLFYLVLPVEYWILLPNHVKSAFTGLLFFWKMWKTWNDGAALTILCNMILYSSSLHGKHLLNLAFAAFHHVSQAQEEYEEKKAECAAQVLICKTKLVETETLSFLMSESAPVVLHDRRGFSVQGMQRAKRNSRSCWMRHQGPQVSSADEPQDGRVAIVN